MLTDGEKRLEARSLFLFCFRTLLRADKRKDKLAFDFLVSVKESVLLFFTEMKPVVLPL